MQCRTSRTWATSNTMERSTLALSSKASHSFLTLAPHGYGSLTTSALRASAQDSIFILNLRPHINLPQLRKGLHLAKEMYMAA